MTNPIRGIFFACCTSAKELSAKSKGPSAKTVIFLFIAPSRLTPIAYRLTAASLNHLIRSCQHIRRNRQADLLRRFQIDYQFELRWLLHGKFGGFCSFQDLVYISRNAAVDFEADGAVS